MLLTSPNLEQVSSRGRTPKIDWARTEEAADFAKTVKLYRQKKYDDASFRRYRLQHGAYGTRMTGDYAMIRVKIPGGRIYPVHLENLANLSESFSIGSAHFSTRENVQLHWVVLEDVSEVLPSRHGGTYIARSMWKQRLQRHVKSSGDVLIKI